MRKCCIETAKAIFDSLEDEPKRLGLEELAKQNPKQVRWISLDYYKFKSIRKLWEGGKT